MIISLEQLKEIRETGVGCPFCDDEGEVVCPICDDGEHECPICDGKGEDSEGDLCDNCIDGAVECDGCCGSGYIACPVCYDYEDVRGLPDPDQVMGYKFVLDSETLDMTITVLAHKPKVGLNYYENFDAVKLAFAEGYPDTFLLVDHIDQLINWHKDGLIKATDITEERGIYTVIFSLTDKVGK